MACELGWRAEFAKDSLESLFCDIFQELAELASHADRTRVEQALERLGEKGPRRLDEFIYSGATTRIDRFYDVRWLIDGHGVAHETVLPHRLSTVLFAFESQLEQLRDKRMHRDSMDEFVAAIEYEAARERDLWWRRARQSGALSVLHKLIDAGADGPFQNLLRLARDRGICADPQNLALINRTARIVLDNAFRNKVLKQLQAIDGMFATDTAQGRLRASFDVTALIHAHLVVDEGSKWCGWRLSQHTIDQHLRPGVAAAADLKEGVLDGQSLQTQLKYLRHLEAVAEAVEPVLLAWSTAHQLLETILEKASCAGRDNAWRAAAAARVLARFELQLCRRPHVAKRLVGAGAGPVVPARAWSQFLRQATLTPSAANPFLDQPPAKRRRIGD